VAREVTYSRLGLHCLIDALLRCTRTGDGPERHANLAVKIPRALRDLIVARRVGLEGVVIQTIGATFS
jgi:hypothetical protein